MIGICVGSSDYVSNAVRSSTAPNVASCGVATPSSIVPYWRMVTVSGVLLGHCSAVDPLILLVLDDGWVDDLRLPSDSPESLPALVPLSDSSMMEGDGGGWGSASRWVDDLVMPCKLHRSLVIRFMVKCRLAMEDSLERETTKLFEEFVVDGGDSEGSGTLLSPIVIAD